MKIEFIKDPAEEDVRLAVIAAEKSERVESILDELERSYLSVINGYADDRVQLLRPKDILRVYAEGQRVLCQTNEGIFTLRARLYEMEERLTPHRFVRISKCELVNTRKILRLDVSLSGTVGIVLEGNVKTYTSRRYMQKIKSVFGIGKESV